MYIHVVDEPRLGGGYYCTEIDLSLRSWVLITRYLRSIEILEPLSCPGDESGCEEM